MSLRVYQYTSLPVYTMGINCHIASPVTCHLSPATCQLSPVTCQLSHVTCHMSPVTCHLSPVIGLLSPVTCHLLPVTCHWSPVPKTKKIQTTTNTPHKGDTAKLLFCKFCHHFLSEITILSLKCNISLCIRAQKMFKVLGCQEGV